MNENFKKLPISPRLFLLDVPHVTRNNASLLEELEEPNIIVIEILIHS
jgi:hypothetical protein